MIVSLTFAVSPRLELFFAFAALLGDKSAGSETHGVRRWLDQAHRRLDQGFRRRLGERAQAAEFWARMAALPLPREAALASDVETVIDAVAALPPERFRPAEDAEALRLLVVDTLRRFDRLAFAAYWRGWREELLGDARRIEARLRTLSAGDLPANARSAIFVPSRFAPPDFAAAFDADTAALLPLDPDRLQSPSLPRSPRSDAAVPRDPALMFRALGDATRYTIAGMIARAPMTSAELARRLDISKPTMAHHLRALRAAGLVNEETRGTRIVLTLDRAVLEGVSDAAVAQLFGASDAAPVRRSRRSRIRASGAPARRR
jgi:DNA-binding transcriptional ArsR family regulator